MGAGGSIFTGAAAGGGVGAAFGPVGAAIGAGTGGLFGGLASLFGSDDSERLQRAMGRMKQAYMKYRPEVEAARMRAMNQRLGAFAPVNTSLEKLYGPQATFDLGALGQNPLHPGAPPGAPQAPHFGPMGPPMPPGPPPRPPPPPGAFVGDTYPGGPTPFGSARRA